MQIRKLMHAEVITLQADEPLMRAVELTTAEHIRHLPVLDGDRLVGMLSVGDIKHATPSPLVEGSQAEYHQVFHETPVSRIMRRCPITAGPEASLAEIVRLMVENKIGAVPVVEGGKLVGIVSELDVLRAFLEVLKALE
ncbi:MAG TPA: CBS domain-containing protein [Planctomycetota bacterium]|nr:CBS domain-containing protein [Planctomycetota bacterium]